MQTWPSTAFKWAVVFTDHMVATDVYPYTNQLSLDGHSTYLGAQEAASNALVDGGVALSVVAIDSTTLCYSPDTSVPIGEWAARMSSEPKAEMSFTGTTGTELVAAMPALMKARLIAEGCRDTSSSCRVSVSVQVRPQGLRASGPVCPTRDAPAADSPPKSLFA